MSDSHRLLGERVARQAVKLIRDELTPVEVYGRPGYRHGEVEPTRGVQLLPGFDNYLLGYRDRHPMIEADRVPEVYVGGIILPTVLSDGRVIDRWRLARKPAVATMEITLFRELTRKQRVAIETEVTDLSRFLALPATLAFT